MDWISGLLCPRQTEYTVICNKNFFLFGAIIFAGIIIKSPSVPFDKEHTRRKNKTNKYKLKDNIDLLVLSTSFNAMYFYLLCDKKAQYLPGFPQGKMSASKARKKRFNGKKNTQGFKITYRTNLGSMLIGFNYSGS